MAKGRANAMWVHGLRAGWTDYRYGSSDRSNITLPGVGPSKRIFKGERRQEAIDQTMAILRRWRQTPFEHEGPTRAAIRSALCLTGFRWAQSDREAEEIVGEALRLLGAKRPSWEEGQRHYAEPRENCKWCGTELDPADRISGFCSADHARMAYVHWSFQTKSTADRAFAAVDRAYRRLSQKPRKRLQCNRKFRPQRPESDQRYCSLECAGLTRRKPTSERTCAHCGTGFMLKRTNLDARFCSKECGYAYRAFKQLEKVCDCCGRPFVAHGERAKFCSMTCAQIVSKMRTGRRIVRLSPPVFDYVVRHAAPNVVSLTPAVFDEVAREAA